MSRFQKIEACTYEYAGHCVERMANGKWDAYLLNSYGDRVWSSPAHKTRESAAQAISSKCRRESGAQ